MNRRRIVRPNLSLGSIVLLIVAALVIASAGVFHAYVKNRQINVTRQIEDVERRIQQGELDIKTRQMLLDEQLNRYLIRAKLKEISSDLRPIRVPDVREIEVSPGNAPELNPSPPGGSTVAGLASGGP